jgi:signal transduction histidine kinase
VVEVEDTGEGIPAEYQSRVFERFVQVPGARARPGAGIGLALVKEIVTQHYGTVGVESELGKGSRFTLRLPRRASDEVRQRALPPDSVGQVELIASRERELLPPQEEPPPKGWARVLVCEDNPDLGPYTRQILLDAGLRVTLVTSAEEALEVAQREPPDLLLTDLGLAGSMDGVQLCQAFGRLKEHQNAPCLVLTANSLPGIRMEAYGAGAVDYIVKPFGPNELVARVNAQLRLRRLSLQLLASERMAAQGTALAGVAHELRNPLNALINCIEPLRASLPADALQPGGIASELLEILEDSGRRVSQLSFELLSVTRVPSSVTEVLDLGDMLGKARKIMEPRLRKTELRLKLEKAGPVRASGIQLSQVVCNLLENALDAAGESG